jgi:hypothetical protein
LNFLHCQVSGTSQQVDEKIESNPRLLTCGYGVVFGRLEFMSKARPDGLVPVSDLRSILLTPVLEFDREHQVRVIIILTSWWGAAAFIIAFCHLTYIVFLIHCHTHGVGSGSHLTLPSCVSPPSICCLPHVQSNYSQFLATQLVQSQWSKKSKAELFVMGPKKLEAEYGNCLRSIVNKI